MYSTNLHDQLINAALPLKPLTTWSGGACTVTVAVPPTQSTVGVSIDSVRVELSLPSGQTASAEAVNVEDTPNWVATFPADLFATSGFVAQGLTVYMGGTDEHSTERVWIVSKGDLEVKPGDASPSPTGSFVVVKLRDSAPSTPVKGDAYIGGGTLYIYDGTAWQTIGVSVDPTLTVEGAAADAKAVGDALRGGFTEWEFSGGTAGYRITEMYYSESSPDWIVAWNGPQSSGEVFVSGEPDDLFVNIDLSEVGGGVIAATRHLITPTKTSQLTNDGDGEHAFVKTNDSRLTNARTPTAHHATHAANGTDAIAPADIGAAAASDLPYRLVEPGKWEFSGSDLESGHAYDIEISENDGEYEYVLKDNGTYSNYAIFATDSELVVDFNNYGQPQADIIATRASLPGHLLDRAGNRVVVSGDTTLTLPAAIAGYCRDFLVRLEISGSTVPTITFAAPTGETITYETDGDEFPVPDEAGDWLYSFTESCVAHKFAVSLKKVNEVAAPQAQGGV